MQRGKNYDAYFTVEAALVLPLVMSAVLVEIYLFCFQYDRCLMEQDMGSLLLWCNAVRMENVGTVNEQEEKIHTRTDEIYGDKYVSWEMTVVDVQLEKGKFLVTGHGQLTFPVPGWNLWNDNNLWESKVTYKCESISPAFYIRQIRKLGNLLHEENPENEESQKESYVEVE